MKLKKESPPIGEMERAQEGNLQNQYSIATESLSTLDGQKLWLAHRGGIPYPPTYKERSERYTLKTALEVVADEVLDGVCLFNGEGIYHDGKRLVIINVYTTEPLESLPFDLLRRVPTYIEKTDFGYCAMYWFPDAWAAQYSGVEHVWLDNGAHVEIFFDPDHSEAPFIPLTFETVGPPHPIASPADAVLDDSLGGMLKEQEEVKSGVVPFPSPFKGPMAEAVKAARNTAFKDQPGLICLAVLIGMAAGCSGYYKRPNGGRLNLYGCGIADTGEGKEQPLQTAIAVAAQAGAQVFGKPASGQALEDLLVSRHGMLLEIDEIAHFLQAVTNSRAPSYQIEMAANLLKLFGAGKSAHRTRARANMKEPPRTVQHPVLSLIGFATPKKLGQAVTVDNVADGLLGRFLFVLGEDHPLPRLDIGELTLPKSVKDAAVAVQLAPGKRMLMIDGQTTTDITVNDTPEGKARLGELLMEFDRSAHGASSPFAKALHVRSAEKTERIAGVLAVWDSPTAPVVTLAHVEWAAAAVRASNAAVLAFVEKHMHGGAVQEHAAKLRDLIPRILSGELKTRSGSKAEANAVKAGWVPCSTLLRHSGLSAKDLDVALFQLAALGETEESRLDSTHPNGRVVRLAVVRLREE